MYNLIVYDTSNFEDFPIGGQLTSIRNFLKYLVNEHPEFCPQVLLVGISSDQTNIGKIQKVNIDGLKFDYLPVLYREDNLASVKQSLRLEYLKALIKKRKVILSGKRTIHYIHTPEAFIEVKLFHPFSKTVVFSHGSFFNMVDGFRFYRENKLVQCCFRIFLAFLLKSADLIFVLDEISATQYLRYTKKVVCVNNSIILPQEQKRQKVCHQPIRLLFVGRLSKIKRIDKIIMSLKELLGDAILTIVGDGEEYDNLAKIIETNNLKEYVTLEGAVQPHKISEYMEKHDILVMNSKFEGKPMTILEAMSHGMPVVTTPVGGIVEMTAEGQNAEYTDGSAKGICKAVLKIESNYEQYEQNAFLNSEKFDYKVVNKQIFQKLCEKMEE